MALHIVSFLVLFSLSSFAVPAPRLAFQVYSVRSLCEKDFTGTLKAAKAMGYEGVETGRFYGRGAKEIRSLMDEVGLKLVALQLYPHSLTEPQLARLSASARNAVRNASTSPGTREARKMRTIGNLS